MKHSSGGAGILGLLALVAGFFLLRRTVPSLARIFLILGGIAALGVAVLVGLVIFFAMRKPKKSPEQQQKDEAARILQQGRAHLLEIRKLTMKVKDSSIRTVSENICSSIDKILRTLKEQPGDIPSVGRFFHYYLPTLQSVLTKYTRLEANGVPAADAAEKTLSGLQDMQAAMEKQYQNLFEDDKLDLTVEMAVLTQICKRDGLLADDCTIPEAPRVPQTDSRPKEEEQGITLTL